MDISVSSRRRKSWSIYPLKIHQENFL